jgi:hypothetical protein
MGLFSGVSGPEFTITSKPVPTCANASEIPFKQRVGGSNPSGRAILLNYLVSIP